jgi:hypothetical protein
MRFAPLRPAILEKEVHPVPASNRFGFQFNLTALSSSSSSSYNNGIINRDFSLFADTFSPCQHRSVTFLLLPFGFHSVHLACVAAVLVAFTVLLLFIISFLSSFQFSPLIVFPVAVRQLDKCS